MNYKVVIAEEYLWIDEHSPPYRELSGFYFQGQNKYDCYQPTLSRLLIFLSKLNEI